MRAALNPGEGEPPWNGMLVWRGVSWMPAHQTGTFMFIAGDDRQKAVVYPMTEPDRDSGEVLVNWALAMPADSAGDATRGDWNREVPVEKFLHHYEGWDFDGVSVPRCSGPPKAPSSTRWWTAIRWSAGPSAVRR